MHTISHTIRSVVASYYSYSYSQLLSHYSHTLFARSHTIRTLFARSHTDTLFAQYLFERSHTIRTVAHYSHTIRRVAHYSRTLFARFTHYSRHCHTNSHRRTLIRTSSHPPVTLITIRAVGASPFALMHAVFAQFTLHTHSHWGCSMDGVNQWGCSMEQAASRTAL